MSDASRRRATAAAFALVGAISLLHVWWSGQLQLSPAEAWTWHASRALALAAADQPPLAPWTIRLTTSLLGTSERTVRLAAILHAGLGALFFFLAGRRLFGARSALAALLGALAMPLFSLGSTLAGPGAPLVAGGCAALYFTVRALEEHPAWLVAAGAAAGWGTLAHAAGALLGIEILALLVLDPRGRPLLRTVWPWLACGLAFGGLAMPLLAPNAPTGESVPALERTMRFLGTQALLATPILGGVLWVAAAAAAIHPRDPALRALAVFAVPPLALALLLAPFVPVGPPLPALGYSAALLAAAGFLAERPRERRGLAVVALATALPASVYLHLAAIDPALPLPARQVATLGWKELAARVHAERRKLGEDAFVLGCGVGPASALAFYLPDRPGVHASSALGDPSPRGGPWPPAATLQDREGVIVADRREKGFCGERAARCAPLERLRSLVVRRTGQPVTTFDLWRCRYTGVPEPRERDRH